MTELPHSSKDLEHLSLIQIKFEFGEVNWVESLPVMMRYRHEFRVLKTVFMLEIKSVFHLVKFSTNLLAEVELCSDIHDTKIGAYELSDYVFWIIEVAL